MSSCSGGSGHLSSYFLERGSFKLKRVEAENADGNRYYFEVMGSRLSEFDYATDQDLFPGDSDTGLQSEAEPESSDQELLVGCIVLNKRLEVIKNSEGNAAIEPWSCPVPKD